MVSQDPSILRGRGKHPLVGTGNENIWRGIGKAAHSAGRWNRLLAVVKSAAASKPVMVLLGEVDELRRPRIERRKLRITIKPLTLQRFHFDGSHICLCG